MSITSGGGTPPSVPNLQEWYDPSDAATITFGTGSNVSGMADKSGNGNHLSQAFASNQPVRTIDTLKTGLYSLDFGGGAKYLTTPLGANTKPCTIFAVLRHAGGATDRAILGTNQSNGWLWEIRPDNKQLVNKSQVANIGNSTSVVPSNQTVILCVTYDAAGVLTFYVNNVADGGATNNQTLNAGTPITTLGEGIAQSFVGTIGETIRYARVLTAGERQTIYDYLAAKWMTPTSNAVRFSAVNQRYSRASFGLGAGDATICGWQKMAVDRGTYSFGIGIDNGGSNYIQLGASNTGKNLAASGSSGGMASGYDMVVGTWVFVALVYRASGTDDLFWAVAPATTLSVVSASITGLNTTSALWIGGDGFSDWFNGSLAAVKMWSAALSQAQLEAELPKRSAQLATNLHASYELNGPSLVDSSPNGRTLTAGAGSPALDSSGPPIT